MAAVQRISDWLALALMLVAAALVLVTGAPVLAPTLLLLAPVPVVIELLADSPRAPARIRPLAMAANWIAAVLVGSLAAVSFTDTAGAFTLFPVLAVAAVLYGWNAVSLALA